MKGNSENTYISEVLHNMPEDWLVLTTHRLDIYDEAAAKSAFTEKFNALFLADDFSKESLESLPTAYDYIRLGHPLSCILEWYFAQQLGLSSNRVIAFDSSTAPLLAILRKNYLEGRNTQILIEGSLPNSFEEEVIREIYGYQFEIIDTLTRRPSETFDGVRVSYTSGNMSSIEFSTPNIDFGVNYAAGYGSVLFVLNDHLENDVADIQHFRRRETVAMTPENSLKVLEQMIRKDEAFLSPQTIDEGVKKKVVDEVRAVTNAASDALVASSGLSMQYAIMMGLVHAANEQHPEKPIHFMVPPNCYGGTNDQARRVAACYDHVSVVDLEVDGDADMVLSVRHTLAQAAQNDAVPYIIAEIPTNPRVEVPDLEALQEALQQERSTPEGKSAVAPVFVLDQTFCPNVHFLGEQDIFAGTATIAYMSGSKFPSGGKCTAGICVANRAGSAYVPFIEKHLMLCDNEATPSQFQILSEQLPSMVQRIADAYKNARDFVEFIEEVLPTAKINFVSEELASRGFTPSVFSLDLPTRGETPEERELYKRSLNDRLIHMMITDLPNESKYCVSYGQLKGCYWTIPATSTQGTTKEADKDYIARVALSPSLDLDAHKAVFRAFVNTLK